MAIHSLAAGVPAGTTITAQQSGPAGGAGVYTTSQATTINAGQTIANLTYRADSQLSIPILSYGPAGYLWASPIRMTGPGSGDNWQGGTASNSINLAYPWANAATIDLRFHGQESSAVGYVATGGSLYNNGSTTTFTAQFTASGGTCSTAMQFTASSVGGVIQAASLGIGDLNTQIAQTVRASCTIPPANPVSATCTNCTAGSGATFNLYWTDGKINAFGVGAVEIDHLYLVDLSASNSTPFLYFTNAIPNVHDNNFACSGNTVQDAIVLGGMQGINYLTQDGDQAFLGYKPTVERNQFNFCNRALFSRTFSDNLVFNNNISNDNCVGDRILEFIDGSTLVGNYQNVVSNNWFEACKSGSLKYGIAVLTNNVTNSSFLNNAIIDIDGVRATNYVSDFFIVDATSVGNVFDVSLGCYFYYPGTNCTTFSGSQNGINQQTIRGQVQGLYRADVGTNTYTFHNNLGNGVIVHGQYGLNSFGGTNVCPQQQIAVADLFDQGLIGVGMNPAVPAGVIDAQSVHCNAASPIPLLINTSSGSVTFGSYTNESGIGTTVNKLAKIVAQAGVGAAKITATADSHGILGVVIAGAATSGKAQIASIGLANCIFDGVTTPGDFAINSPSVAGDCADTGNAYPATGQVIGIVMGNGGPGSVPVSLFPPH